MKWSYWKNSHPLSESYLFESQIMSVVIDLTLLICLIMLQLSQRSPVPNLHIWSCDIINKLYFTVHLNFMCNSRGNAVDLRLTESCLLIGLNMIWFLYNVTALSAPSRVCNNLGQQNTLRYRLRGSSWLYLLAIRPVCTDPNSDIRYCLQIMCG